MYVCLYVCVCVCFGLSVGEAQVSHAWDQHMTSPFVARHFHGEASSFGTLMRHAAASLVQLHFA